MTEAQPRVVQRMDPANQLILVTVRDWVRLACTQFRQFEVHFGHGTDNVWDEAIRLVFGSLSLPPAGDDRLLDAVLLPAERERLADLLYRRVAEREPVPYLLGEAWFMGLPFIVDRSVLVPRSHLGELLTNELSPWLPDDEPPAAILDLCCGSGCIGIAAGLTFRDASIVLSDISEAALKVAERNVQRYALKDAAVVKGDLFEGLNEYRGRFDVILCNPPYVDAEDMAELPAEYRHEPELGLVSGDDGLDFTRRLLAEAADYLTEDGILVCEIGNSLGALLESMPALDVILPEFEASPDDERGSEGVFIVSRAQLLNSQA